METVRLGDVLCTVKRSARRSVCVRVRDDGAAEVLAPNRLSRDEIVRLLSEYAPKLAAECEKRRQIAACRDTFVLDYGSEVRYLGEKRVIHSVSEQECDGEVFRIADGLAPEEIRCAVTDIYKREAKKYIPERVRIIAERMGLFPTVVKINSAVTRWASCSKKNSLNFSWYCMMASREVLDYIIVHELCHMKEFNHSPKFWAEVEPYSPEYKEHRAYLRELSRQIKYEKWE